MVFGFFKKEEINPDLKWCEDLFFSFDKDKQKEIEKYLCATTLVFPDMNFQINRRVEELEELDKQDDLAKEDIKRGGECQNKVNKIIHSSGYQIVPGNFGHWGPVSNLPWGPRKATGDLMTQRGGIWDSYKKIEKKPEFDVDKSMYYVNQVQNYVNGPPGTLISK